MLTQRGRANTRVHDLAPGLSQWSHAYRHGAGIPVVDTASIISLIAVAIVAIFSSITAPLILARRTERMHREDQLADYKRQDQVAKEAKETAIAMAAQQDVIIRQQKAGADAVQARDEAAGARAAEVAKSVDGKLDVLHGLANSTLSAALESELGALETSLAMMNEVIDLKKAAGIEPTREAVIAIESTEAKIAELKATLADRLNQAETIAGRAAAAAASAADATKSAKEKAKPLLSPRSRQGKATG